MKSSKPYLLVLFFGTLQIVVLISVDVLGGGGSVERFLGFNRFLAIYWSAIALSIYFLMIPLGLIHVFFNSALNLWKRCLWALAFLIAGCIAIPAYCLVYWRRNGFPPN
jgi:hypothetical protein